MLIDVCKKDKSKLKVRKNKNSLYFIKIFYKMILQIYDFNVNKLGR